MQALFNPSEPLRVGTFAYGVSGDGSVVIGQGFTLGSGTEAFRWTAATGNVGLGQFPGGNGSDARGVSDDGSVVVGFGDDGITTQAFRWTQPTGFQGLGFAAGAPGVSEAHAISGDGSTIVGIAGSGSEQAFRWTQSTGMQLLDDLGPSTGIGAARAFGSNIDGSVIVGESTISSQAFRWTLSEGVVGLGNLPGGVAGAALDVSDDGNVVVGWEQVGATQMAFRWLNGSGVDSGLRSVSDLLTEGGVDLTGWELNVAAAVSGDGRIIVGTGKNPSQVGAGANEAWLAVINTGLEPPDPPDDPPQDDLPPHEPPLGDTTFGPPRDCDVNEEGSFCFTAPPTGCLTAPIVADLIFRCSNALPSIFILPMQFSTNLAYAETVSATEVCSESKVEQTTVSED